MKIVDIRETAVPLNSTLRNAVFDFSQMTTSVVAVETDVVRAGKPIVGFAFNSTGRYACGGRMRRRFIPRLLKADPDSLLDPTNGTLDPAKALAAMMQGEKPGGDADRSIAIGTIEVAIWDALAKIADKPLHRLIAERWNGGKTVAKIPVYVGGGWYAPGKTLEDLKDEMRGHQAAGYALVKMKVGGAPLAEDMRRLEAVLTIRGSGDNLAVDANCRFNRTEALAYADAMAPLKLRWFEEPCEPADYALMAELSARYAPPLATGENLFSTQDVENLIRYGGMRKDRDLIQIDPPQSYGIVQFQRTLARMQAHQWTPKSVFPHGGNRMSLNIAAGFGLGGCESYPGVFGPFGGFGEDVRVEDGMLTVPDAPGIGFEMQNDLFKIMRGLMR